MHRRHSRGPLPTQEPIPAFLAGDIVLFASTGDLYSKLARWLMRGAHEAPTYAVHTAQFIDDRRVLEMDMLAKIETVDAMLTRRYRQGPLRMFPPLPAPRLAAAASRSDRVWLRIERGAERAIDALNRRYWQGAWRRRGLEVWRCRTLTTGQRAALTREALLFANVRLGFLKFCAHLLDDLLCKLLRRDVFLFRHGDPADRHPVCSGVTAAVYDRALHYRFGVDPECADPDQIYDWVRARPDEWERVFRRDPMAGARRPATRVRRPERTAARP